MEQMDTQRRRAGRPNLILKIWMIVMLLIGLVIIILTSAIHVRLGKQQENKYAKGNGNYNLQEDDIIRRYPGSFRTLEQQRMLERKIVEKVNLDLSQTQRNDTMKKKPHVLWTLYNACCESNSSYTRPRELQDINGNMQQIIQYTNNYQYVLQDTCETVVGCGGKQCDCQCKIINFVVTLVHSTPKGGADLGLFNAGEVCKCMNIH